MKGRRWTAEEKLAIILEGIKGGKSIAEMCREPQSALRTGWRIRRGDVSVRLTRSRGLSGSRRW